MKHQFVLFLLVLSQAAMAETIAPPPPGQDCHDNMIFRKWQDVLFVNNGNGDFVSYQWYRDGQAIAGATGQYYSTEGVSMSGDGHMYHATATTGAGRTYICCAKAFDDFIASRTLNPAVSPKKAALYSATGRKVGEWDSKPERLQVAPGCYVWYLTDDNGESWTERVMIP